MITFTPGLQRLWIVRLMLHVQDSEEYVISRIAVPNMKTTNIVYIWWMVLVVSSSLL